MRTLDKLGIHSALSDELGFRGPSGIPQIYRHWKTNQVVSVDTYNNVPDPRHYTTRFHRGHIHAALLEHVPGHAIHLNKRIVNAEENGDGVTLNFDDGSSANGDILIGADGIRSQVRQSFFPEHKLRFSGKVFIRSTFDASLVEGKVLDLPADAVHWWGPKGNFFASKLGKGQYTTVGAYVEERSAEELEKAVVWDQEDSVQFFREKFKDWNPVVKRLTELTPNVRLYPNYIGEPLPTWILASRVVLIGDAAHTHGGAFAAGGSLALNDSLALALALKHVFLSGTSPHSLSSIDIQRAFELYDKTRRPHATRLLTIIHNQIFSQTPEYATSEEEDEALITRMKSRPNLDWLSEHDVEKALLSSIQDSEKQMKVEHP